MLLDEFVDFRVRAGETERQEVERERARRVREHGWWSRALMRARGAVADGAAAAGGSVADGAAAAGGSVAAGGSRVPAGAPVEDAAEPAVAAQPVTQREPELAHVGR